jgi:hypothetical protein
MFEWGVDEVIFFNKKFELQSVWKF